MGSSTTTQRSPWLDSLRHNAKVLKGRNGWWFAIRDGRECLQLTVGNDALDAATSMAVGRDEFARFIAEMSAGMKDRTNA